jgi:cytochrome c553
MRLSRALKWIGISLGGILGLLCVAALVFFLVGRARLNRKVAVPAGLTAVPGDSSALARGEHILRIHGCQGCHGEDLSGRVFLDIPLGRFVATNLTRGRGGIGATYHEEDWDHAIRFGVRADHTSLVPIMPYRLFNHLSDADAAALIAYLKRLPPIDNLLPSTSIRLPGYIMVSLTDMQGLFGRLSQPPPAAPPSGTAPYGAYLASTICVECHGEHLQGGKHPAPDAPPAPSLVPAAYWSQSEVAAAVRTGIAPGNRKLSDWMPSQRLQYLTDEEIQGLYAYLQTLRPSTTGR